MTSKLDARFSRCSHIGAAVWTDQTEGQCRDQHQCSVDLCPLQDEFAGDRFKINIEAIAGGWVGLFPLTPRRRK